MKWNGIKWNGIKWNEIEQNGRIGMTRKMYSLTISTSEIGPILLTCMLISTTKGGPEKSDNLKFFGLDFSI